MSDGPAEMDVGVLVRSAARRYGMNLDRTDLDAVMTIARRTSTATAALVMAVEDLPLRTTDPDPNRTSR